MNQAAKKPKQHKQGARLMLLGNGEYLIQLQKKYGPNITLAEVIKKEHYKEEEK